jgi:hypothetical protein
MTGNKKVPLRASSVLVFISCIAALSIGAAAQTPSLSLSGASGTRGGTITLGVVLNSVGAISPAAIQWDLTYSAADLSLVSGTYSTTAMAGEGAGKSANCNSISAGDVRCIVSGINRTAIGNGLLASLTFQVATGTTNTSTQFSLVSLAAADANADALSVTGSSATVAINQGLVTPVLSALNCIPASVTPPASSTCTVTLSSSALNNTTINLSSSVPSATVPASVDIAVGLSSAAFMVNTSAGGAYTTAEITAALGSSSQSFSLGLTGVTSTIGLTSTSGLMFYPLTPCRIADTRVESGFSGAFGAPSLSAGSTRSFPVPASNCNVPVTAQAYSLNITAVPPGPLGYLTAWPTGSATPLVATLNSLDGAIVGNAAIVSAGTNGAISLLANNATDVVIDINGYFAPSPGLAFYPVIPCRVADTRSGSDGSGKTGAFGPPSLAGGGTRDFSIPSSGCGIPASAQAYSVRMTAVAPAALGYLTTWPAGQTLPLVATLNALNGGVVGNEAIVPAGANGAISVFVSDNTDLVIDVNGYFAPPGAAGALAFYALTPCRVADTRPGSAGSGLSGAFGPPSLNGNVTRDFPMLASSCGIPSTAQAYSLNMTVVPPGPMGFLTAWPAGQPLPLAATVNATTGAVVGSASIVLAGTNGDIDVFANNPTDLVIDISGYFAP